MIVTGKQLAEGNVRTIFNYGNTTFEQQYEYINDLTNNVNEQMLVLPNLNDLGYFKITDEFGVEIEDAIIKLQGKHYLHNEQPLRTINQKITDVQGLANFYYESGDDIRYWISISAEGFNALQENIDLNNLDNGNPDSPYVIRLTKSSNSVLYVIV